MEVWIRNAYYVSQGQNPYGAFMPAIPGLSFTYLQVELASVGYLPVWSLLLAGLYKVYSIVPGAGRFFFYFLVKQPTVLGDVYLGWLVFRAAERWGPSRDIAVGLLRYWMFFPYAIIISAVWGQFDSIVAAFLLSLLLCQREGRRILWLGFSIALKWFPVIFVPLYAFREGLYRRGLSIVSLAIPPGITVFVFTIMGWDYVGVTAMAASASHGGGGGLTYFAFLQSPVIVPFFLNAPHIFTVLGYLWVPGVLISGYVAHRRFARDVPSELVQALMFVTIAFFLTRWGMNEQYLTYLFPLFLIDTAIWHPERRPLYTMLSVVILGFVLVNNDLLVRFLGPVSTSFVDIAYGADASPDLGLIREFILYFLNIMFTVTSIQLAAVLLNPTRRTRPWPLLLVDRIRRKTGQPAWASRPDS